VASRDEVLGELAESLGLERSPDQLTRVREALKQIDWRSERREAQPGGPPGQAERMGEPERAKPTSDHAIGPGQRDGRSLWVLLGAMVLSFLLGMRRRRRP
jgi:hypothetical protein